MDEQTASTTQNSTTSSASERKAAKRAAAHSAAEVDSQRRKFSNLTNGRVRRAIMAIRVVANIAKLAVSKDQLSDDDVNRIMGALDTELGVCARRLRSGVTGQQLDIEFDVNGEVRS